MGRLTDSVREAVLDLRSVVLGPYSAGDRRLAELFGVRQADSGVSVTEETALSYGPFWSAVTLISNAISTVPLHYYRRTKDDGRERYTGHPLDRLVSAEASDDSTAFQWRRAMQMNALIAGNAYSEIVRTRADGRPAALHLIDPMLVDVARDPATRRIKYRVANLDGRDAILDAADVIHLAGPSRDGLKGLSPVAQARQAIGLGIATERFGARFFGAGARMGGVLTTAGRLSPQGFDRLKGSLEQHHGGVDRSHKLLILEEGLSYVPTAVPPEDAQFLATRTWQVVEIARWFNLPSSLLSAVHEGSSLTYRNATDEAQRAVDLCYLPWASAWEQELARKLISPLEHGNFYFAHTFAGLLRGDLPTRYSAFKTGIEGGWLSVNDVRRLEDLNPVPGGDTYRTSPQTNGGDA